ncbi:MAG TPA: hypothetical protein VMW83_04540 [Spirochaetia bacterium]|nr:hypothetical protein [Spirochaetia bacterium]
MVVQIICVPAGGGFLTLVWPGGKDDPPLEGQVRVLHENIMDLLNKKVLEAPECLKVSGGVTYWQARWKHQLGEPGTVIPPKNP